MDEQNLVSATEKRIENSCRDKKSVKEAEKQIKDFRVIDLDIYPLKKSVTTSYLQISWSK